MKNEEFLLIITSCSPSLSLTVLTTLKAMVPLYFKNDSVV